MSSSPSGTTLPKLQAADLEFAPAVYLAPMEGVTDRSFRGLVLEQNPGAVGAACTEFLRVSQQPLPLRRIVEELGDPIEGVSVGVQLMGNQPDLVAETARRASDTTASFIDLNFGCPAPRVFQHCAGSALLAEPALLESVIRQTVDASSIPVTAKIRAGIDHDRDVEELAKRVEQAGATLLTVHGRLRTQSYRESTPWDRIRRAVDAVSIPVIGNGSAESPVDIDAMFEQTGCAGVMVGRAAIGDPWIFARWRARRLGVAEPDSPPPIAWLRQYEERMLDGGALPRHALGKLKQALKAFRQSGLLSVADATTALRCQTGDDFFAALDAPIRA